MTLAICQIENQKFQVTIRLGFNRLNDKDSSTNDECDSILKAWKWCKMNYESTYDSVFHFSGWLGFMAYQTLYVI